MTALKPTVVVLNSGLWPSLTLNLIDIQAAVKSTGAPCIVWKSTTPMGWSSPFATFPNPDIPITEARAREAFASDVIFDTVAELAQAGVPVGGGGEHSYWDPGRRHFTSSSGAYHALNMGLLRRVRESGCLLRAVAKETTAQPRQRAEPTELMARSAHAPQASDRDHRLLNDGIERDCAVDHASAHARWQNGGHFEHLDCVVESLADLCPGEASRMRRDLVCVPIEALQADPDPRPQIWAMGKNDSLEEMERRVLYKPWVVPYAGIGRRHWYIDVGANSFESSMGDWFLRRYPNAARFNLVAIEPNDNFRQSFVESGRRVDFLHFAASTHGGTVDFAKSSDGRAPWASTFGGRVSNGDNDMVKGSSKQRVRALDLADFLRRRVDRRDYVVLKLDVESAEYTLVPHLLQTGAHRLIDELFMEVHTDLNSCCRPPHDRGRHRADALRLIQELRRAGVYAHEWI